MNIKNSFAPVLFLIQVYGFSPACSPTKESTLRGNICKALFFQRIYNIFMGAAYFSSIYYLLLNFSQYFREGEIVSDIIKYSRLGNNVCYLMHNVINFVLVIVVLLNSTKIASIFNSINEIDLNLTALKSGIDYEKQFTKSILLVISMIIGFMLVNIMTFLVQQDTLGQLKISVMCVMIFGSNGFSVYMLMFSAYISEFNTRFIALNGSFDR